MVRKIAPVAPRVRPERRCLAPMPISEVVEFLRAEKPGDVHVILTGRNAAEELIGIADLVTEMEMIKHPFRSGVKAQKGIEF